MAHAHLFRSTHETHLSAINKRTSPSPSPSLLKKTKRNYALLNQLRLYLRGVYWASPSHCWPFAGEFSYVVVIPASFPLFPCHTRSAAVVKPLQAKSNSDQGQSKAAHRGGRRKKSASSLCLFLAVAIFPAFSLISVCFGGSRVGYL